MGDSTNMFYFMRKQGEAAIETLKRSPEIRRSAKKIIISGAGDKYCVSLIAKEFADLYTDLEVEVVHPAKIYQKRPRPLLRADLFIFITQSGKTKDIIEAMKVVDTSKAIVITNLKEKEPNSVYEFEDAEIINTFTDPYPERPLPSTQTFFASSVLALKVISDLGGIDVYRELMETAKKIDIISKSIEIDEKRLKDFMKFPKYYIADSSRFPIARRSALILGMEGIKEDLFAVELEEFVHSLIETNEKEPLSMYMFMPYREEIKEFAERVYEFWRGPKQKIYAEPVGGEFAEVLSSLPQSIEAEFLSYYAAIKLGRDPGVGKLVHKVRSSRIL